MSEPTATTAQETEGLEYHQLYRQGRKGWWWYVAGIATMAALFLLVSAVVVVLGAVLFYVATGTDAADLGDKVTALADTDRITPSVLLFINLVLILAIPSAWFCTRVFHDLKPRWLASVGPRIRWKWLLASFGVALVSLLVAIVLAAMLPASGDAIGGQVNDFTSTTRDFLIVVLLLTPLQAVAEEYAFRGYLTQAFGGLFGSRFAAVVGPALLFAAAHGAQSLPVFLDRLAFGIVAGVLVIATGGLEAGIAYHVLNNLLAFGSALAFSDMTSALNPAGGSYWDVAVTIVKSLVFLGLSVWVARRMGVATRTRSGVLEGPRTRV